MAAPEPPDNAAERLGEHHKAEAANHHVAHRHKLVISKRPIRLCTSRSQYMQQHIKDEGLAEQPRGLAYNKPAGRPVTGRTASEQKQGP